MGRARGIVRVVALLSAAAALVGVTASVVQAELTASGNLFVTFNGGIEPGALRAMPAHRSALDLRRGQDPVGRDPAFAARDHDRPQPRRAPRDPRLPTCKKSEIELDSTAEALAACRDALVGSGKYRARTKFPEQAHSPSHGDILAFNARVGGRPAILGHVYGAHPAPSTGIIVFKITTRAGPSGPF